MHSYGPLTRGLCHGWTLSILGEVQSAQSMPAEGLAVPQHSLP